VVALLAVAVDNRASIVLNSGPPHFKTCSVLTGLTKSDTWVFSLCELTNFNVPLIKPNGLFSCCE